MANRDLSTFRQVTEQVAENPSDFIAGAADFGQKLILESEQAKIPSLLSKARLEVNALANQHQIDWAHDPNNEQAQQKFDSAKNSILSKYKKEVSPLVQSQWNTKTQDIDNQLDLTYQAWQYKQSAVNTQTFIQDARENYLTGAYLDGKAYAGDPTKQLEGLINHVEALSELKDATQGKIALPDFESLTKGFDKDYMKAYLAGVAEDNPQAALSLLNNSAVDTMLDLDDKANVAQMVNKSLAIKRVNQSKQEVARGFDLTELINSEEIPYLEKELAINKMLLAGQIPASLGSRAKAVLRTEKEINAVTSTPVIADIITKVYDLNALGRTESSDFLDGVKGIQEEIIAKKESGELSAEDVRSLNNTLKTLLPNKMAEATQNIGRGYFSSAITEFKSQLPPEMRGEAIRELYYRYGNKKVDKAQLKTGAMEVIKDLQGQKRSKVLQTISTMTENSDATFLSRHNITMQQVESTARLRGFTVEKVINDLRGKLEPNG
jgi:hypothetical protein